jgi:hypothetical protein
VHRLDQKPPLEMAENADSARAFVERLLATGRFRLTSLKHLKSENLYLAARGLALPACFSTALIRSSSPNSMARSYRISHTYFAAFHFPPTPPMSADGDSADRLNISGSDACRRRKLSV